MSSPESMGSEPVEPEVPNELGALPSDVADIEAPAPTPQDELGRRLDGLAGAVAGAEGRLDESTLQPARELTGRAGDRLRMSGEHTIVALAGATGSGKSSLFNALTDLELAGVGVRRPTTSWALACAWGPDGAEDLLAWMGIPARHQVSRMGMLERGGKDASLEGLILLDLPDHDSTEVSHHLEMDRLVTHSDMLIWVLDPQKYADAAIHERYIRKMAGFGAVTMVVLNQIDRIPYEQRNAAIADVKRLIEEDGLPDVKVLGVSATRGDGLQELRLELAERIRAKNAARDRLLADVAEAAHDIEAKGGTAEAPQVGDTERRRLAASVAESAGIPQVVESMASSSQSRTVALSQWPPLGVLNRDRAESAPELGPAQQSATDMAVREFVDHVSSGLSLPWRTSVRAAVHSEGETTVSQALDQAVRDRGVRLDRVPAWARVAQVLQWILIVAFVIGLLGLAIWAVENLGDLQTGLPGGGEAAGFSTGGWLAVGALIAGLLIDVAGRAVARSSARKAAAEAETQLRSAVDEVTAERVVTPVESELKTYSAYRTSLLDATN